MDKEKKTEQINLRLTKSEKDMLYRNAGIDGKNVTEYIINLIKNNSKSVSYEQYITDSMTENNIINNLFQNNTSLQLFWFYDIFVKIQTIYCISLWLYTL